MSYNFEPCVVFLMILIVEYVLHNDINVHIVDFYLVLAYYKIN